MCRRNNQRGSLSLYRLDLLPGNGCQAATVVCYLLDDSTLVQLVEPLCRTALAQIFNRFAESWDPLPIDLREHSLGDHTWALQYPQSIAPLYTVMPLRIHCHDPPAL